MSRELTPRWWRSAVTVPLVFLGVMVCLLAAAFAMRFVPRLPLLGDYTLMAYSIAGIAAALPIAMLTVRLVERRPAGSVFSTAGRIRRLWLAICLAIAVPTVLAGMIFGFVISALTRTVEAAPVAAQPSGWPGVGPYLATVAIVGVFLVGQVTAEEYISRGIILQAIGRFSRSPWPAIAGQAVVFAALHGPGTVWGVLLVLAMGVALGWLTTTTGGIEAGIAFHLAVSGPLLLITAAFQRLADPTANAAGADWQNATIQGLTVAVYATIVGLLATRTPLLRGLTPRTPATTTQQPVRAPASAGAPQAS
ncbi:CPBP family intramembrane glutamic endopeptidase [Micromonospora sp. WMMA1923]|uniref:CPBP family intramembrane glutamic endopeptidase n=1 Tax=Micromonospora sp. WMMA1923 TaxID=3404125 RepID=UPI003B9243DA